MKALSLFLLVLGLLVVVYSVVNRLTLMPTDPNISFGFLKSANMLLMANTILLVSLIIIHYHRYK